MGRFYIETEEGILYELSSTPNIKYVESGSITDHVVGDGSTVSDNYKQLPIRIDYTGTVTSADLRLSPEKFARGLVSLKRDVKFVTAYSTALLLGTAHCLIENVTFEHTPKRGVIRGSISSKVSFSLRQVRLGNAATVEIKPAAAFADFLAPKEKTPAETSKQSKAAAESESGWKSKTKAIWDKGVTFSKDKLKDKIVQEVF